MLAMKQTSMQESYRQNQSLPTTRVSTSANQRPKHVFWQRASIVGCILTCSAVFWMIANNGAKIDSMNYSIDKMQSQIQKASAENASLTSQVDNLQRPERILGIATGPLHMQYASPVHIQASSSQSKH
jgi:cell division protein FtsL